jgi:hypothetical protein
MIDAIDALSFHDTFENPERYEAAMQRMYDDARRDAHPGSIASVRQRVHRIGAHGHIRA